MYTEQSIELKSDFYSRYGSAALKLYFERTGLPCVLLNSGTHMLAFALGCGARAYGRECGDILRIINADSDECDVRFAPHGLGAQILYKEDIPGVGGMRETVEYTIIKLLCNMRHLREPRMDGVAELCDNYGSGGWCAYYENGVKSSVPLPLMHYNVVLVRMGKRTRKANIEGYERFCVGETERIRTAAEALESCRMDVLFDIVNESEKSIEKLLAPPRPAVCAARAAAEADGVLASRICDIGVICITEADMTDSAIQTISHSFERSMGYPAGIEIVK